MILLSKQHFNDALRGVWDIQATAGYQFYAVMADGGDLCLDCAWANRGLIASTTYSTKGGDDPAWTIQGFDQHFEGEPLQCDNCYNPIEPTYTDD